MISKRTLMKALGGTALATLLATGAAQAAEVTLRMHQFLPAQANAEKIMEESDGRIEIQHYPAMQLGGTPPELIDQVIDGVADIVWTLPGYTPGRFPHTEVFELPFMMTDAGAMSAAYYELAQEIMFDDDFKDVKVLGTWVHGPGVIHSKEPIETVADLNGVKLRAPTRVTNKMFETLGATPIGLPVPGIPEALSKGVVDATVIPWEVTGALKVAELVHNHTEFPGPALYAATFVFAMNKDKWDSLPDDLKEIIDRNSGAAFSEFAGAQMQRDDAGPREIAVDLGNNIIELTEEQAAEWQAAAAPTVDSWIEEMAAKDIDGQALIDKAKALIEKHSAM